MKRYILVAFFAWLHSFLFAQKHDAIWFLDAGYDSSVYLNFADTPLVVGTIEKNLNFWGGTNVVVCDSLGNLLFYTNGIAINDASYQQMQNGDSLNYGDYTIYFPNGYGFLKAAIALPKPNNSNLYYLFHIRMDGLLGQPADYDGALNYTLIDMNLNGGPGAVIEKNVPILDSAFAYNVQAVKHANGHDWWVVGHTYPQNGFYTALLTEEGVRTYPYQDIGQTFCYLGGGDTRFSPDGSLYAKYDYVCDLDIYDFDRCTGAFSNHRHIEINDVLDSLGGLSSIAFSPNSRFLYVVSGWSIYQFDMQVIDIAASKDTIAISDSLMWNGEEAGFGYMDLAPDGKIYIDAGCPYLHVINNPNAKGDSCMFRGLQLDLPIIGGLLLNFPHYRTPALPADACDTTNTSTTLPDSPSGFGIYPNPTQSEIMIDTDLSVPFSIDIIDITGRVVLPLQQHSEQMVSLPTQLLPAGIYVCRLHTQSGVFAQRFVVLK